ncbi:LysR family transcriptional regulator [Methylobacterium oxalidis]|uniref:LysR family transcriptional regulator n=1 Tax=Methylobacterium oxalidis TaxID=944322 RepID=UPI00331500AB
MDLEEIRVFALAADLGSLTKAASRLNLSKSVVSRRLSALESRLGVRLLNRTTRGIALTELGQTFFARARRILTEVDGAVEAVTGAVPDIAGQIRMTAPVSFGTLHLMPALSEFLERHPRIEIELELNDRVVDLIGEGFDLAVRIGHLEDSGLVARRVAPVRHTVVGSPAFLHERGEPERPRDLGRFDCVIYSNASIGAQWRFKVGERWESPRVGGRFRVNNAEMLVQAALLGVGLASLPTFVAGPLIASGQLKPILRPFPMPEAGLFLVFPPDKRPTAKLRAVIDHLTRRFGPEPSWDPGYAGANPETHQA